MFLVTQLVYTVLTLSSLGIVNLVLSFKLPNTLISRTSTLLYAEPPMETRGPADDNIFSRFVKTFLPTPEDIGLQRYDKVSMPENYPCVKNEWADLIPEDKDKDIKLIRQVLAKTNMEYRPLKLAYSANRDGWNNKAFHKKVDTLGPAVVLARSSTGLTFGGYNPCGWVNEKEYRGSIAAFLFTFPDNGDTNQRPIKLAKIAGAGMAQIDDGSGPKFGMEGFTVPLEGANAKIARSKLGLYYERMPDGRNTIFDGNDKEVTLTDLKVFVGVYGKDERIPFSGAMFFQLN